MMTWQATTEDGRLTGNGRAVAVTRALGDAAIKAVAGSGLLATPECRMQIVSVADELLILGCDGPLIILSPYLTFSLLLL